MSKIKPPMIILNFKNYSETIGKKGLELAKIAEAVAKEKEAEIIVCPQTADIRLISSNVEIPVFAQHVDPEEPGAHTGALPAAMLKAANVKGSLVNHSEKKLPADKVKKSIESLHVHGLESIVCAATTKEAVSIANHSPAFIAVEPPELIGSGVSVSEAKPEIIINSVKAVKEVNHRITVLCGAGVSNKKDITKSLELGAEGVLLASAFVNADDPKAFLSDLASVF